MNIIDVAVVIIIAACVLFFSYKGFVMAAFDAVSVFLSFYLARLFAPRVAELLRAQPAVFDGLKNAVYDKLGLAAMTEAATKSAETVAINSLALPGFIKDLLLANNNADARAALNAGGLGDYAAGFLANMLLGILVLVLLFVAIFVALKIIAVILDIAARLPIINAFNKIGGALVGLLVGLLAVYLLLALSSLLLTTGSYAGLVDTIESSRIASFFFNNNFITSAVSGVFGK